MSRRLLTYVFLLIIPALSNSKAGYAQDGINDTLLLGVYVVAPDTFPMVYMENVTIKDKLPRKWARKRAKYNRLRHNIYKVYPYAVIAADVLKDVDSNLIAIGDDKSVRRDYLKGIEKELKRRFKGEIEDMTITQGHVLVKLIDRQTGKSCYHIIKELKGGFSAAVFQSIAVLFSHNLKADYDGDGEDSDMEEIVRELESTYRYEFEYKLQQSRLHASKRKS
ncbi:MAG: DUF4294 domain-containing protein [Chitinophagales bacterium]|nr:DUF4294 domain-containing protein [Chitinophagales bacterium]